MVKLIRLQGDADVNNEEIRNTFKQPILIQPNSKVALVGASAHLQDEIVNENFIIGNSNKYFKIGSIIDNQVKKIYNAEITPGSYSAAQFVEQFGTAANYAATDASAEFLQHQTSIINNRFYLETYNSSRRVPQYSTTAYWTVYDGSASAIDTRSITAGAAGIKISMNPKTISIPMFNNLFETNLVNCSGGAVFAACECSKSNSVPVNTSWGLEITASNAYRAIIPDPEADGPPSYISLGQSWAANDRLVMNTFGGRLVIRILDASANLKASYDEMGKIPRVLYEPNSYGVNWNIQLPATGQITDGYCSFLDRLPAENTIGDTNTSGLLQFLTPTNTYNVMLATFAGFGMNGSSMIPYKGNPAHLEARETLIGLAAYPGLLISVDGLPGLLESFDGSKDSRSQSNVVYVVNDLSVVTSNQLQLDIPAPFFLNLKNSTAVNINELRARFLPSAGSLTNKAITFSGKPTLTLLIDG